MADAPNTQNPVTGSLPLYKSPEPISVNQHQGKGLTYTDRPFDFLKGTHFVPVTLGEFGAASTRYPIIFLGEARTPVAAMGLVPGQNLFVTDEGMMEPFNYLPGFVRRYPFVSASHTDDKERFTICVDTGSHLFSDAPQEPFFTDEGKPTPFLERSIDFVRRFESEVVSTQQFVERMKELDLFEEQSATFQPRDDQGNPQGEPQNLASYWGISGEKLRALSPDVLAELRDNTYLGGIYAHMISITQWDYIIQRAARANAQNGVAPAAGTSAPPPPAPEA